MRKDPRINASSMSIKKYSIIFLIVMLFCGNYAGLYFLQIKDNSRTSYIVLSMLTYLLVISAVVCLIFALFRRYVIMKPVYKVCDAARRLSGGDFSARISPMRRDGKKDEFEVLFDDFNIMAAELESTEIMKSDFISNVSHEFKTPLAVIQNYTTLLDNNELSDDERKEYLARINSASSRLSSMVTNILQINRLENQQTKPDKKTFNLSEALSRCVLNYDELFEEKDISLDVDLDQNILLYADEQLLDAVWNNLISNAIKFTSVGGNIGIVLQCENDVISVTISDNGCGMNEYEQAHAFDKFYQADSSHQMQGNGLGLALAKRITTLMDGQISVRSIEGEGTTFKVEFIPADPDFSRED